MALKRTFYLANFESRPDLNIKMTVDNVWVTIQNTMTPWTGVLVHSKMVKQFIKEWWLGIQFQNSKLEFNLVLST